jgi:hypothetical protein
MVTIQLRKTRGRRGCQAAECGSNESSGVEVRAPLVWLTRAQENREPKTLFARRIHQRKWR